MERQTTTELNEKKVRNRAYEIPPDKLAVFDAATAELRASGIKKEALKEGDRAPDFTLNDAHNQPCRLSDCLTRGPVVLSFYRGGWCPYCNIELRGLQIIRQAKGYAKLVRDLISYIAQHHKR